MGRTPFTWERGDHVMAPQELLAPGREAGQGVPHWNHSLGGRGRGWGGSRHSKLKPKGYLGCREGGKVRELEGTQPPGQERSVTERTGQPLPAAGGGCTARM